MGMFRKKVERLLHNASYLDTQNEGKLLLCCCIDELTLLVPFAAVRFMLMVSRAFGFQPEHVWKSA